MQEELGSGAMGTVYRAIQRSVRRPVAIKFLTHVGPEYLARFVREGRVLARISHPAVIRVFDCGDISGHPFLVTELLGGGTLSAKLAAGALPWPQAVSLAIPLLEGLAAAHAEGIVHRDLKPDNILFGADGEPRIADLGVASDDRDALALTKTGAIIGTPLYMAPEQLAEGRTGPASDLWSMAAIVFEMIAGQPPYVAHSIGELGRLHRQPPPRLDERVPAIPRALAATLERALAPQEAARPASALALAEELGATRASAPPARHRAPSRVTPALPLAPAAPTRRLLWAVAAAASILAALVFFTHRRPAPQSVPAVASPSTRVSPESIQSPLERGTAAEVSLEQPRSNSIAAIFQPSAKMSPADAQQLIDSVEAYSRRLGEAPLPRTVEPVAAVLMRGQEVLRGLSDHASELPDLPGLLGPSRRLQAQLQEARPGTVPGLASTLLSGPLSDVLDRAIPVSPRSWARSRSELCRQLLRLLPPPGRDTTPDRFSMSMAVDNAVLAWRVVWREAETGTVEWRESREQLAELRTAALERMAPLFDRRREAPAERPGLADLLDVTSYFAVDTSSDSLSRGQAFDVSLELVAGASSRDFAGRPFVRLESACTNLAAAAHALRRPMDPALLDRLRVAAASPAPR